MTSKKSYSQRSPRRADGLLVSVPDGPVREAAEAPARGVSLGRVLRQGRVWYGKVQEEGG
jgi:hypothetical protein